MSAVGLSSERVGTKADDIPRPNRLRGIEIDRYEHTCPRLLLHRQSDALFRERGQDFVSAEALAANLERKTNQGEVPPVWSLRKLAATGELTVGRYHVLDDDRQAFWQLGAQRMAQLSKCCLELTLQSLSPVPVYHQDLDRDGPVPGAKRSPKMRGGALEAAQSDLYPASQLVGLVTMTFCHGWLSFLGECVMPSCKARHSVFCGPMMGTFGWGVDGASETSFHWTQWTWT